MDPAFKNLANPRTWLAWLEKAVKIRNFNFPTKDQYLPIVDELSLSQATMMTSTYASATEVDDTMRMTAIDDNPPSNNPQLTAAVGEPGACDTQTEPGLDTLATPQTQDVAMDKEKGKKDDDAIKELNAPDDGTVEQGHFTPGRAETEVLNMDLNPVIATGTGESQILDGSSLEAHKNEAQVMVPEGLSGVQPMQINGMEDHQDVSQLLMAGEEAMGIHDPSTTILPYDDVHLMPMDHNVEAQALLNMMSHGPEQSYQEQSSLPEIEATRIQAYAKLEFGDGEFYMNTYSVFLGRDVQAARAATRRDKEEEKERERLKKESRGSDPELRNGQPHTPVRIKREESKYSRSVLSETGGILREYGDSDDSDRPARKKKSRKASKGSKSTGSSSQHVSRRNSIAQTNGFTIYQPQAPSKRAIPETAGAASLDLASLRPSPHECPLIGIHPPASSPASVYKSISRKHVKIAYNLNKRLFEVEILGRNGAFIDDEFYHYTDVAALKSGSVLQIGCVTVRFVLPDVVPGQTGAEQVNEYDYENNFITDRYSEGGKEMSFDFEDGARRGVDLEETSESSDGEEEDQIQEHGDEEEEGEEVQNGEELEDEDDQEDEEEEEETLQNGDQSSLVGDGDAEELAGENDGREKLQDAKSKRDKKRGPGRPPKDGVMSKREKKLANKEALAQQKQKSKKTTQDVQEPTISSSATGKNKVGRPRKHPRPDTPPVQKEKRKYTKRKPKEPKDPNAKQDGSAEDQPAKDKKEKKPTKPPRSPSPEVFESQFTAEELNKPAANYVTLIYDALTQSTTGPLSLPDIYRAIARKYPYFKFKCHTNGWQSSVRHNLSQHHAFTKVGKEGKGFSWAVVEGVSIEKEKKRRTTPPPQGYPPMHRQPIYQAGYPPHMMHPYTPGMMPPPGYQMNYMPPNGQHVQHPQFMPQNGPPPHQPNGPPPMNGHFPPSFPISIPPQLAAPNNGTYSSPYASKPPAITTPQPNEPRPSEVPNPIPQPAHIDAPPQPLTPTPPEMPTPAPELSQPEPIRESEDVQQYIQIVRPTLLKMLSDCKNEAAEAVLDAVGKRFQGISTGHPPYPHEEMVLSVMNKGWPSFRAGIRQPNQTSSSSDPNSLQQQQDPPQANETGTQSSEQPSVSIGSERSASSVMRPSFSGRPNGGQLSRPPLKTPGMQRMNSGSPASAPPKQTAPPFSASPAASSTAIASPAAASPSTPLTNGASTPKLATSGNGPPAEQPKVLPEDTQPMQEVKRLNENGQLAGLKRPLEDTDENQDPKRRATDGSPKLRI